MIDFNEVDSNLNPRHPLKGNDAFLVAEYSAYVTHPDTFKQTPNIEQQHVNFHISSEKCDQIFASGAQNNPYDAAIQLFVDIDGDRAISISETRSGWHKWMAIIYSFGIKCDNTNHRVEIRVNQWIAETFGMFGRWQEIFRETHVLRFEKTTAKKKEDIVAKIKEKVQ